MNERINYARKTIENEIRWAEEAFEEYKECVIKAAERNNTESILSWAGHMKDCENKIKSLREQLKVVEFIENEK